MEIKVTMNSNPKAKPEDESKLGFGQVFTDHMFVQKWTKAGGWEAGEILPFGNLDLHPACTALHYGEEIFEGLKAYRTADDKIQLFRPEQNAKRFMNSSDRLALPQVPEEDFIQAVKTLVEIDKDWVPHADGASLYIRPFLFGTSEFLGLHTLLEAVFVIILSPSGAYYPQGINPVKIMVEESDVRAVRGGTGYAKCGGNYGASQRAGELAEKKGYTQVLWLDGVDRKYIEEVGAMNMMFKINGTVVTPMLNGSILPGVTRNSIIQLLKDWGVPVEERRISIDEVIEAAENGSLEEAFGCGTAAVVSPVGWLFAGGKEYVINNGLIGDLTGKLYKELTDIQWGRTADPHNWIVPVTD